MRIPVRRPLSFAILTPCRNYPVLVWLDGLQAARRDHIAALAQRR